MRRMEEKKEIWLDNKKKTKTNLFNLSVLEENWNPFRASKIKSCKKRKEKLWNYQSKLFRLNQLQW